MMKTKHPGMALALALTLAGAPLAAQEAVPPQPQPPQPQPPQQPPPQQQQPQAPAASEPFLTPQAFVPLRLPPGARVRLTKLTGGTIEGYLSGHEGHALWIALPTQDPLTPLSRLEVPVADLSQVEVSTGRRSYAWLGALLGTVLIGLTGLTDPVNDHCEPGVSYQGPCSRAEAVAIAAIGGTIFGGAVGFFVKSERWTPVALEALDAPPERGAWQTPAVGAGVRLRF